MTCREFVEFLNAYLDGDLSPGERVEFERHLAICPACVRYLASYDATVQATQAALADVVDTPDNAPKELIDAILSAKRRGS